MVKNGYWIECVPLSSVNSEAKGTTVSEAPSLSLQNKETVQDNLGLDLYAASTEQFPELSVTASSPDLAIEKLRAHLKAVREDYKKTGKRLPDTDNPVKPPRRLRRIQGWISVYVDMSDSSCGDR